MILLIIKIQAYAHKLYVHGTSGYENYVAIIAIHKDSS